MKRDRAKPTNNHLPCEHRDKEDYDHAKEDRETDKACPYGTCSGIAMRLDDRVPNTASRCPWYGNACTMFIVGIAILTRAKIENDQRCDLREHQKNPSTFNIDVRVFRCSTLEDG